MSAEELISPQQLDTDHPLTWRNFVSEPSILAFLADRVQQEPHFKRQLQGMIERSKTDKEGYTAAANAITTLVRAGIQLNGADLRGIRIRGADLSGGVFDSAQLQGADLSTVNLRNIWLRQADLSNAQMSGVQFGEWSYITEDSAIVSCAYSPDGKSCAIGLGNRTISVYDTSTWAKIHTLSGHRNGVTSAVYSPSGHQIASGSWDNTVRLRDTQISAPGPILSGHTKWATSVVYSPNGQQIASGSYDKTVRLWDAVSGQCVAVIEDFHGSINSIAWCATNNGSYFATGCSDKSIRIWQVIEGDKCHIHLHWSSSHDQLVVSDTTIQDAQGLSNIGMELLKQRGAAGRPISSSSFCGASKKLNSMVSAVSQLEMQSNLSRTSRSEL